MIIMIIMIIKIIMIIMIIKIIMIIMIIIIIIVIIIIIIININININIYILHTINYIGIYIYIYIYILDIIAVIIRLHILYNNIFHGKHPHWKLWSPRLSYYLKHRGTASATCFQPWWTFHSTLRDCGWARRYGVLVLGKMNENESETSDFFLINWQWDTILGMLLPLLHIWHGREIRASVFRGICIWMNSNDLIATSLLCKKSMREMLRCISAIFEICSAVMH